MIYDLNVLDRLVDRDVLKKFEKDNLVQYTYTDKTRYEGIWNANTLFNRGNVYDKVTGELVAKSLPKFFNYGQLPENLQNNIKTQNFLCTEKYDGELGIIFKHEDTMYCSTRHGFDNNVTEIMYNLVPRYNLECLDILNIVVEVISPETHTVVDYGTTEELILITAYNKVTETEISYDELVNLGKNIGISVVPQEELTWEELFEYQHNEFNNTEGYVLRFAGNLRVKLKNNSYIDKYKEQLDITPRGIFKLVEQYTVSQVENIIRAFPDELYEKAEDILLNILDKISVVKKEVKIIYNETKHLTDTELFNKLSLNRYSEILKAYKKEKFEDFNKLVLKLVKESLY